MPRRPGEPRGDEEKTKTESGAGANPAPPQLLGVHFHTGAAAPLHPQLKTLLTFWSAKRGSRPVPARADLPVYELKPWFGQVALLESALGTFRFRLSGVGLIPRLGCDATGLTLADLAPDLRKPLMALLDLASSRAEPAASATVLRFEGRRMLWSDLMLPLAGGRSTRPLLIFGSYPVDPADGPS